MMRLTAFFFFILAASADADIIRRGRRQNKNGRDLKGKGGKGKGGDIYSAGISDYEEPPAGVLPGDVITDCDITLTDDLDCRGAFDCLTLDATDGDVTLDCDGYTIGNYDHDNNGIDLMGCCGNTITIKNCYITGFEECIDAGPNGAGQRDYNIIVDNTATVGCKDDGMQFKHTGDLTLNQVVVTGNGEDGIRLGCASGCTDAPFSPTNVILNEVFACGNAKDSTEDDIVFEVALTSPPMVNDVTADNVEGETITTTACPIYEDVMCVSVNGS